jgi:hypothetical protein
MSFDARGHPLQLFVKRHRLRAQDKFMEILPVLQCLRAVNPTNEQCSVRFAPAVSP